MKKMNINLNLSDLSGRELSNREKLSLRGGDEVGGTKCCQCACCYEGEPGGSDWDTNRDANAVKGLTSPCGLPSWPQGCVYPEAQPEAFYMDWCAATPF